MSDRAKSPTDEESRGDLARGGIGAEWFPVKRVSVVGATGMEMYWTNFQRPDGLERDTFNVSMFRSAIYLNLYF